MPRQAMTVEHLWALPRVGSPRPSPDGQRFIVPVTTYDMPTNEGTTRLWLGGLDPAIPPRALTTAELSTGQAAWSPDGRQIAFVRKPGGRQGDGKSKPGAQYPDQAQLYVMPVDGGEPTRLTDLPLGAADPRFFPDGKRIAFLAVLYADRTGDHPVMTIERTAELVKARADDPVKVRISEDRLYRFWDRWLTDGKLHHICVLDLETRAITDLMPDSERWFGFMDPADEYRIAPDGAEIAFSACRSAPPHDPLLWGVFTVDVATHALRGLTDDHPSDARRPVYSPDGRWILYGMQQKRTFYADRERLAAYDRRTGAHTVLTEAWDRSADGWTFGESSDTAYLVAEDDARTNLYKFDLPAALAAGGGAPALVARGGHYSAPEVAGGRLFSAFDNLTAPPEVVTCRPDSSEWAQLTHFTAPVLDQVGLHQVEELRFTGAEGDEVQMFVLHPPEGTGTDSNPPGGGADPTGNGAHPTPISAGPRPLVHMIHGGPHGVFGDQWHWRWCTHVFGAPGYVVALVNFHGSTSWGQHFAECIQGRWGDQPYQDLMAATDLLIQRGTVDPARMAATGGSYGGYMASWIAGQTDRFACIVNHAGVCDLQMEWASDVTQGWSEALGGEPWGDLAGMDRWNPMRHAAGFKSPMLILHGEQDFRVPYDQGMQIYNVYKAMKLPARLVCYPDENHWVLKPQNSRHWYGEVQGWLARWLG